MKRFLKVILLISLVISLAACGNSSEEATTVEVSAPPEKVSLEILFNEDLVFAGSTVEMTTDSDEDVIWASSDEKVATVDENGNVTALSAGSVTITAAFANDTSISASTTINIVEHVSSVSVAQNELTLLTGSEKADAALDISIFPENAFCQDVECETSDSNVVTVDNEGNLHAVAPGIATITVKSLDEACQETATCVVTVKQGVSSITLSETALTMYIEDKGNLVAEVLPVDAENSNVIWASTDETVVSVSEDGGITPVSAGQATITCTAEDGSEICGECLVTVVIGTQKLSLSENNITLLIGAGDKLDRSTLQYTVLPENSSFQSVVWSSSDENIATVDENGTIIAVAPGKATITATTTDPKMAEKIKVRCTVTVGNAVQNISFSGLDSKVAKGTSHRLTVEITPSDAANKKLTWTSSNEKVMTVDANGNVRAVGVGKATITATATDGSEVSFSKEYTVIQAVTKVTATERGKVVIFAGQSVTLHATVSPNDATNKTLKWQSSDSSIAEVSTSGKVTAKRAGSVVITATSTDGSDKSCKFTVIVEPSLPISIESLGFGVYNANLLGITVKNHCSNTTIKNFDFTINLYSYDGSKLSNSGSYSLGEDETISAGSTRTIKRTLSGIAWTQKIVITITGVKLSNGTYYSIPLTEQKVCTFMR